jgi:glycerol-3-phosphate acyltransferase PlsY
MEQLQSANWKRAIVLLCCSYALGCVATGYYLVRVWCGRDVRETGSGNAGARNVGRLLGKTGFFITLLGDIAKGMFAVWAARRFTGDDRFVALALLAVTVGHVWPAQLKFRGGKGVATSLGGLLIYDPQVTLAYILIFTILFAVFRRTTLPGILTFGALPLASMFLSDPGHAYIRTTSMFVLAGLIMLTHRKNLIEEFWLLAHPHSLRPKPNPSEL